MDAELEKIENRRKKIFRKKHLFHSKSVNKNPIENAERSCKDMKKIAKRHFLEGKKIRKKHENSSTVFSSTGLIAHSKTSSIANTENTTEKDVSSPFKTKKRAKMSKKKLANKNKVNKVNESTDLHTSKNTTRKRKLFHLESEDKHIKNKKKKCPSSNTLNGLPGVYSDSSKTSNRDKLLQQAECLVESDSDEDQDLRDELKKSSIFKNIQKLLKDNPCMVSSVVVSEEEHSDVESLGESDLDEECLDNTSSDETHEENVEKHVGSNKYETAVKGFKKTKNDITKNEKKFKDSSRDCIKTNHDDKISVATSICDFNRTQRCDLANRNETKILKKETPSLRNKALEKLQGAKFRYLNEKLYTESGRDSYNYFQKHKDEYMDYHKGYSLQVAKWPLNPVDKIITSLQNMKKKIVVADMGCGDAKIAQTLIKCTVHSFDLVALNDFVTPCNISKVPLPNESVDVVVFCLSLMGINLKEYLQEAYRIAKLGGILKIAEVESRIPSLEQFITSIEALGFSLEKKDVAHKLFVFLEFRKTKEKKKKATVKDITLKPCLYKKR